MANLLLMDDSIRYSFELVEFLEHHDHETVWARTAESAKHQLQSNRFDLLISDMFVANTEGKILADGGLTLINWIRNDRAGDDTTAPHWLKTLPIIAISGSTTPLDKMHVLAFAKGLGANEILHKPFEFEALLELIDKLLVAEQTP